MKRGIDVSEWQDGMDFDAAKADGMEFCIVRLGRGLASGGHCLDESFISNINGAIAAGMQVGIYFYTKAVSVKQAAEDAAWVKEQLDIYCQGTSLAVGIWYDVEDTKTTGQLDPDSIAAICSRFVSDLNAAGYGYVGIYSSYHWLTKAINIDALADYVPVWAANYGSGRNWYAYENPARHCPIWQYADNGTDPTNNAKGIAYDSDILFEDGEDQGELVF